MRERWRGRGEGRIAGEVEREGGEGKGGCKRRDARRRGGVCLIIEKHDVSHVILTASERASERECVTCHCRRSLARTHARCFLLLRSRCNKGKTVQVLETKQGGEKEKKATETWSKRKSLASNSKLAHTADNKPHAHNQKNAVTL